MKILKDKWFAIRADGNQQIGMGHIMRCLAFVEWARKVNITAVLITRNMPHGISHILEELAVEVVQLPKANHHNNKYQYAHSHWLPVSEQQDADDATFELKRLIEDRGSNPLFIMVDHYSLAELWEKGLAKIAPILTIDDLHDRPHSCSWLVDQTYGKSIQDYSNLVNSSCDINIGPKYALLRPEFSKARGKLNRKPPSAKNKLKILITLGGVDSKNTTGDILRMLSHTNIKDLISITIVVGSANPNLKSLEMLCEQLTCNTHIIVNSNNMAFLMATHDICIGAAGSTSWERCSLALPTLSIVLAQNQISISENLHKAGAVINLGVISDISPQVLETKLRALFFDENQYMEMARHSFEICDGLGCQRILSNILETETC